MKKVIALLTLMMFAASLLCVPTVSLAAGTKSANLNVYTTTTSTWNGTDCKSNDGDITTLKSNGNRNEGNMASAYFDMLTLDSRATAAGIAQRTEIPTYNKIVMHVHQWNTKTLSVYHATTVGKWAQLSDYGWKEDVAIDSFGQKGAADCNADLYQAFSFDATNERYVGYTNEYKVTGYPFTVYEVEVYYVTPDSMEITTGGAVPVNPGDTFTATADVLDVDGDVINDSALNGITWAIEGTNATIDSETGLVTIGAGFSDNEEITITATSTYDSSISASKTITLLNKDELESVKKSENYLLNMPGSSNWSAGTAKMVDGNYKNHDGGGNHSAAAWQINYDMSSHDFLRYNKLVIHYLLYNTEYITIKTGSDSNVNDGLNEQRYVYMDYTNTDPMKQIFSFDTETNPYIQINNKYWYATNANDAYKGRYACIAEIEAFYVKPVEIELTADDVYTVAAGSTISPDARVLDIDGDEILDTTLNGIAWSVSGSDDVSVDSTTGVITVNNAITKDQTITLTATGYDGISASKDIRLTTSTIGKIEFDDVPDFIMTNKAQAGSATFYPSVSFYGHDGSLIEDADVVWSIECDAEGIELIDSTTGAFTVDSVTEAEEFTLVCAPTSANESFVATKTIKVDNPVNIAFDSLAWGVQTWGGAAAYKIFDGDLGSGYHHGNHSGSGSTAVADLGAESNANYMVARLSNLNNSSCFRISASNELSAEAPASNGVEYALADLPMLAPTNGNDIYRMGTTLWSGRSNNDEAINSNYEQEHILTENEIYSYLDTNLENMRYIAISNLSIGSTADYGVFGISEFELYNTAPNYVKINLPETVDISTNAAEVTLTADVYNGLAAEDASATATGTWSAQYFDISEDGVLSVPSTDKYVLGTITYSYVDENAFESSATIYVCSVNGELKFSDTPNEFIGCVFGNGLVEKNGTIYAPADMDVSEISGSITSDLTAIDYVMITDAEFNEITVGEIVDGYTVYVVSGDIILEYTLATASSLDVNLTNENGTYTATCSLKADVENATLIIAEFSGNKLVNVDFDAKTETDGDLAAVISGVTDGNTVKTMLIESITSMKPLK